MHELAVTDAILETALSHARENGAIRIRRIHMRITELSHLQGPLLQSYFDSLSKGTIAAGAHLQVEPVPPRFTCNACGGLFDLSPATVSEIRCAYCASPECVLVPGTDYELESIEVE